MKKKIKSTSVFLCAILLCLAGCNDSSDVENNDDHEHVFDQEVIGSEYLKVEATCTTPAEYYYSCECGEAGSESFTYGSALGHSYGEEYESDESQHWHICIRCGEPGTKESHTLVESEEIYGQVCEICGYEVFYTLEAVTNITYSSRTVTFDAVTGATEYLVEFLDEDEVVSSEKIDTTSFEVDSTIAGHLTIRVTALAGSGRQQSEPATLENTTIDYLNGDLRIEAEDCVLNSHRTAAYTEASGDAFACDFNDAGEGMYIRYYAYEAGDVTFTTAYATGNSSGAKMKIFVNEPKDSDDYTLISFTEVHGYYGSNAISSYVDTTITLEQGWNDIYMMKHSFGNSDWGGYVQIDYFDFKGNGKEYSYDDFDKTSYTYRFESECSYWVWDANENQRPTLNYNYSMGYSLWQAEDLLSFKFTFKVNETGTYRIQHCFARDKEVVDMDIYINDEWTKSTFTHEHKYVGDGTSVDDYVPTLSSDYAEAYFVAGRTNTIEIRYSDNWFISDYILLTQVVD